MRGASRRAFPARDLPDDNAPRAGLAEAIVGFVLISMAVGTLGWAASWLLADEGLIDRSIPWWAAVRLAGLTLMLRAIWSVLP